MTVSAWLDRDRQFGILISGILLVSLAAFVGKNYGLFDMNFVVSFGPLPLSILLVGMVRWTRKADTTVFYRRLLLGLLFGLLATAAYDLLRLVLQTALPLHFNAFAIHPRFGALIIHQPRTTTAAIVTGWAYHISNGLTFALCWTLVAGRARWWYAVIYALILEGAMVAMYPTAFGLSTHTKAFLTVSIAGHATYGLVLGVLTQRWNVADRMRSRPSRVKAAA